MPDYTEWYCGAYRDGETYLRHEKCDDDLPPGENIAEVLATIEAHVCPGRPEPIKYVERCEHGAPVWACKQHPPVVFPIVRR